MKSFDLKAEVKGQPTYHYQGVIHVHSKYSDGRGSIERIMKAANQCHLDYLILTDHNSLPLGKEGYYGKCLLLVGEEVTP